MKQWIKMKLELKNILVTGRTFEEYFAFFDLKLKDLVWQENLRLP